MAGGSQEERLAAGGMDAEWRNYEDSLRFFPASPTACTEGYFGVARETEGAAQRLSTRQV